MKRRFFSLAAILTFSVAQWSPLVLAQNGSSGDAPKSGSAAPQFSLPAADGATVVLKDYAGKSKLVLVFYRGYW
jgi:cytochrome oxidase Cu insertion factor (SCO1/SenC/PrrC family)